MIKRKDGSMSPRGLWDNIRDNKGSGKKPTKKMLEQERKIRAQMDNGGTVYPYQERLNQLKHLFNLKDNEFFCNFTFESFQNS